MDSGTELLASERCGEGLPKLGEVRIRVYVCEGRGLEIDRNLNEAISLARWPSRQKQRSSPLQQAA